MARNEKIEKSVDFCSFSFFLYRCDGQGFAFATNETDEIFILDLGILIDELASPFIKTSRKLLGFMQPPLGTPPPIISG